MAAIPTTGKALVDHWTWAAEKGIMNRNSAAGLRAACSQVLSVLDGWQEIDVTSLDLEDVVHRFKNIRARDFNPKSLEVYESRFKNALASFREYVRDPGAWRPASRQRSQDNASRMKERSIGVTEASEPVQVAAESRAGLVDYPYPLREGETARLMLPRDIKLAEARRLYAFMRTLAVDFEAEGAE